MREAVLSADELRALRLGLLARPSSWRWRGGWRWASAVMGLAVAGAIAALWITLRAHFLAYPGWLAVQKADFIVGPIGVGLYWMHRRPGNRMGLLLIVLGLLGVPYILASSSDPTLFGIGVLAEDPLYVMAYIVILAFPTGRLEGRLEWLVIAMLAVFTVLVSW